MICLIRCWTEKGKKKKLSTLNIENSNFNNSIVQPIDTLRFHDAHFRHPFPTAEKYLVFGCISHKVDHVIDVRASKAQLSLGFLYCSVVIESKLCTNLRWS